MAQSSFKQPDLSPYNATEAEREAAARYTRILPVACLGTSDAHTTWLCGRGGQFCVTASGMVEDTAAIASHHCLQLAKLIVEIQADAWGLPIEESNA